MSTEEFELKKGQKAYLQKIVNEFKEESKKYFQEIDKLKEILVNGNDEHYSIKEINTYKNELAELRDSIFELSDDGETIAEVIAEFREEVKKNATEVLELRKSVEIYENQLFGKENEDGDRVGGVKEKIDNIQIELQQSLKKNEDKQNALLIKIEELLEGASTVALAKAFKEHKEEFDKPNRFWSRVFVCTLIGLMVFTLISFYFFRTDLKDMWKVTLGNIPFIGAGVWLAIFASKQRSQNNRLQQEYAYKEDVAKLYYGLKSEIDELGDSELGKKLNESVLKVLVDTVAFNPSVTLENKSHEDKGPILDAVKSISESMKLK
jgi:hypothetical protein